MLIRRRARIPLIAARTPGWFRWRCRNRCARGAGGSAISGRFTLPAVAPGVIAGALLMFILALNEFLVSLLLVDARTVTLPVHVYNSIRAVITPDLAAVSSIFVLAAALAIWALDRLVGLDIFLKAK